MEDNSTVYRVSHSLHEMRPPYYWWQPEPIMAMSEQMFTWDKEPLLWKIKSDIMISTSHVVKWEIIKVEED